MRTMITIAAAAALLAAPVFAEGAKSYQVTGPVIAIKGDVVTVKKGTENWEINKGATTFDSIKEGDRITVEYTMSATKIIAKDTKKSKP